MNKTGVLTVLGFWTLILFVLYAPRWLLGWFTAAVIIFILSAFFYFAGSS